MEALQASHVAGIAVPALGLTAVPEPAANMDLSVGSFE